MRLFSVIFMNLWGYDILIFITAVFTAVVYGYLKRSAERLYNKMHLTVFVPDGGASRREADREISGLREQDVVAMRNHTGKLYSLFVNLTGIFPLLGILGTVVSLLGMVSDNTNVTGNFYGALTSTFWGLVFAIIFKFLDGIISPRIEDNEKTVELYLARNFKRSGEDTPYPRDDIPADREKRELFDAGLLDKAKGSSKRDKLGADLKKLFAGDGDEEE